MTPEEALQMIDNVLAQVSLNRPQHEQLMQAVEIVRAAITPPQDTEPLAFETNGDRPDHRHLVEQPPE